MHKKQIIFKHIILLFLSGGIIFLFSDYLKNTSVNDYNRQRNYIVVKAFGAINYHETLIFQPGWQVIAIISAFDLQRGANLQAIFYKKSSVTNRDKNIKWQKISCHQKIYEDSHLKITS